MYEKSKHTYPTKVNDGHFSEIIFEGQLTRFLSQPEFSTKYRTNHHIYEKSDHSYPTEVDDDHLNEIIFEK